MIADMIRTLSIIISIMVMLVSCQTNVVEEQKIELKNQLIGLTSAHNADSWVVIRLEVDESRTICSFELLKFQSFRKKIQHCFVINTRCNVSMISVVKKRVYRLRMLSRERLDTCRWPCLSLEVRVSPTLSSRMNNR